MLNFKFFSFFKKNKNSSVNYKIHAACITDKGKVREVNEDNYYFDKSYLPLSHNEEQYKKTWEFSSETINVMAVFDGMGGEAAGELASYSVAYEINKEYEQRESIASFSEEYFKSLMVNISDKVNEIARANNYRLIGSTLSMILFFQNYAYVVNVGDSPIFIMRDNKLRSIYEAHTNEAILKKNNISRKPALTQFMGLSSDEFMICPYVRKISIQKNDIFMICSDGLTDMISLNEIADCLANNESEEEKCNYLCEKACNNGGRDNITVIIAKVKNNAKEQ